jgi:predicted nucleic acid-binding protein
MPVVSNTSSLWNLASLERLEILHEQFSDIKIPYEVWQELQMGQEYPEVVRIQRAIDAQWITVESLANPYLQQSLMLELDAGESAAIALALELGVSQILLDETDGRMAAKAMGLRPIGVLGVLLRAKDEGKIVSVSHDMVRLRHEAGFFIAESLFQRVRELAGE